ncbi:dihydrofolate reductase family protein [Spirillospora sp. CA-294931]|uniref:dihydrofolate reductase family protein n=1 Tax=Spirillospora sp. CA-294931 TaxID=3240042 RepID=UPI003D8F31D1
MAKIITNMSMSLDGFVADTSDNPAQVFGWFMAGDVETPTGAPGFSFRTSAATAAYLSEAFANNGALVCGRKYFDQVTQGGGWKGTHPMGDVPLFVVTHSVPDGWPREGSNVTIVTDGLESAVDQAKAVAGDRNVGVATADITQQLLNLGLLDEITVELVPVLLGSGVPFFANLSKAPITLGQPTVIEGIGVTHLRYTVS